MDITRIKNLVDAEIKRKIGMATLCEAGGDTEIADGHRRVAEALTEVLRVYLNATEHSYHPTGPAPPGR